MANFSMEMLDEEVHDVFGEGEPEEEVEDTIEDPSTPEGEEKPSDKEEEEIKDADPEDIFGNGESIKDDNDKKEETKSEEKKEDEDKSSEPDNSSIYSSFAEALKTDGVLSSLTDDFKVNTADDFKKAIEQEVQNRLDATQKRINEAIGIGVQPEAIKQHESAMAALEAIDIDKLKEESAEAEEVRKTLIYHAALSRGYDEERAKKEVEKSLKAGSDIDDAIDALEYNKQQVKARYDAEFNKAKKLNEDKAKAAQDFISDFSKTVTDSKDGIWDSITEKQKKDIIDAVSGSAFVEKSTGRKVSAIQHYSETNPTEFLKNVGLCFTLTNGFKNMENLSKLGAKKAVKSALSDLEKTIKRTSYQGGNYTYANSADDLIFDE